MVQTIRKIKDMEPKTDAYVFEENGRLNLAVTFKTDGSPTLSEVIPFYIPLSDSFVDFLAQSIGRVMVGSFLAGQVYEVKRIRSELQGSIEILFDEGVINEKHSGASH
jgi:hypothetical protein